MNREIKFRAWDKREKKMYEADFFDNFYVINQGRVGIIKVDVFDNGSSFYVDYSGKIIGKLCNTPASKTKTGKRFMRGILLNGLMRLEKILIYSRLNTMRLIG
jgi:hypothetical protein